MVKTVASTHRHSLVKMTEELPASQGAVMEGSDSEEEETVEGTAAEAAKSGKYPCIRCKNNFTKASVRCNTCHLWVHTKCQRISKELYSILRNPGRFGGIVTWNCDSCAASAVRLERRMVAIETKFNEVEGRMEKNENKFMEVEKRVDTVEKRQEKVEDLLAKERERARRERVEETRERDVRKRNVVMHGIEEAGLPELRLLLSVGPLLPSCGVRRGCLLLSLLLSPASSLLFFLSPSIPSILPCRLGFCSGFSSRPP